MKKQFLAVLLTLAMLLSLLPASALAAEGDEDGEAPVVYTETGEDPEADPADVPEENPTGVPDEPDEGPAEGEGDSTVTDPEQEEPAEEPTAVEQLQARINALPDADALAEMDTAEQAEVYAEVDAIYDAIKELTVEEADALDTAALEAAAAFFNSQIMPLDGGGDDTDSNEGNVDSGEETAAVQGTGSVDDPWIVSADDGVSEVKAWLVESDVTLYQYTYMSDDDTLTLCSTIETADKLNAYREYLGFSAGLADLTCTGTVQGYDLIFEGTGAIMDFQIPDSDADNPMTELWGAQYPYQIVDVTVGEGITEIGEGVLRGISIKSISLPDSLTTLAKACMRNSLTYLKCDSDYVLTLPEACVNLEDYCLHVSSGVYEINLPENLTAIPYSMMNASRNLHELYIPAGVKSIGFNAFGSATHLKTLEFAANSVLETIGSYAFQKSISLKQVSIPDTVKTIEAGAFSGSGIINVDVPDSVTSLGSSVFNGCTALETASIGNGVATYPQNLFKGCTSLTSCTISDSVTIIGQWAFQNTGLTSIVIPASVTTLGDRAFLGNSKLKTVYFDTGSQLRHSGNPAFYDCPALSLVVFRNAENLFMPKLFGGTTTAVVAVDLTAYMGSIKFNGDSDQGGYDVVGTAPSGVVFYSRDKINDGGAKNYTTHVVNGVTNGGQFAEDTAFEIGVLATTFAEGWTFQGWYTDAFFTNELAKTNNVYQAAAGQAYYAKLESSIAFDLNGGTGDGIEAQTFTCGKAVTLQSVSENSFSREGYTFVGWNTKADGSGTSYADGASVTLYGPTTLYAEWTQSIGGSTSYTVNAIPDQIYTGAEITPAVVVKDSSTGDVLASSQYSVSYANNTNVGTATATVTMEENEAKVEFNIVQDANPSVSMADVSATYDGNAHAVTATAKTSAGNEITGKDIITIKYYTDKDCTKDKTEIAPTNAGTYYAKATLEETTNYAQATATAKIEISNATFRVTATGFDGTYNGLPHSITVTPEDADVTVFYCTTEDGEYTSTNPEYTNAGEYTVYYKATKDNHDDVTGSVSVKIAKATLTATYAGETINVGETPKLEVTVTGFVNGETAGTAKEYAPPTLTNSNTAVGNYELTPAGGSAANYDFTYVAGTLTIRASDSTTPGNGGTSGGSHSSSSSSSASTTYTVTVDSTKNGTVAASPKNAKKDDTVTLTVTPKDGYELDDLTVTDKNGKSIKVTEGKNGKFTFTMPAGKVTVEATFAKIAEQPKVAFTDVPTSAYYYDAVAWAVENGVTGGTTATTFSPNAPCTRAQAVTFLWRAAGSPAPKTSVNPFADVSASAYCYDAVLWAVEQGITVGTSATTFSPDTTCTRGQIVTFLYRAKGTATTGSNPFTDVSNSAYYYDAVKWAVAESVTAGTGATTFSPDASCTRAQIVTFLYRAYA